MGIGAKNPGQREVFWNLYPSLISHSSTKPRKSLSYDKKRQGTADKCKINQLSPNRSVHTIIQPQIIPPPVCPNRWNMGRWHDMPSVKLAIQLGIQSKLWMFNGSDSIGILSSCRLFKGPTTPAAFIRVQWCAYSLFLQYLAEPSLGYAQVCLVQAELLKKVCWHRTVKLLTISCQVSQPKTAEKN